MQCNFSGLFDLILWLVLSAASLLIGITGLREPARVWYWFEWLHWKQTLWYLGIPPDQLADPKTSVEKGLVQYPQSVKILRVVCGCMAIVGIIFLASWVALLLEFLSDCL